MGIYNILKRFTTRAGWTFGIGTKSHLKLKRRGESNPGILFSSIRMADDTPRNERQLNPLG